MGFSPVLAPTWYDHRQVSAILDLRIPRTKEKLCVGVLSSVEGERNSTFLLL